MLLDRLSHMDSCTLVTVSGLAGQVTVFRVNVLLSDLLKALSNVPQGGWASTIHFDLRLTSFFDGTEPRGDLVLAAPSGMPSSQCGPAYAVYCNGRYCGETNGTQGGAKRREVFQEDKRTLFVEKSLEESREETPTFVLPRPRILSPSETYHVRLIVHRIEDILQFGELFPDIYIKARMKTPLGDWRRTDVHRKTIHSKALFEYRLVLAPFKYPLCPVRTGFRRHLTSFPPTLEIRMMDHDRFTRDDTLGSIALNLEELPLPEDDRHGCGLASLSNERVNLFDKAALRCVRHRAAVFPREVTGYWPLLRKKKMNREVKAVGSIRLTIQLLTAKEEAKCPVAQGNKTWALNSFPTLARPKREHGKINDKIILETLQFVEAAIARATGIPTLRAFIVVVLIVIYLLIKVKKNHIEAIAEAVHHSGRVCVSEYPNETLLLLCFCMLSCVTWTLIKSFSAPKGPELSSSME